MQWMKKWGPGQRLGWLLVFLSIAGLSTGAQLVNNDSAVAGAARTADLETVRELIDEGADVNVAQADGTTALLWAAYQSDAEMVRTLIEAGAELDARNYFGVTPLLQASRTGDAAVIELLIEAGADATLAHPEGETPLMAASRTGRVEALELLLAAGADVNATDSFQEQTALMWAATDGHLDAVDVLLEAGADPNTQAHITSLEEREHADFPTGGFTALMFAARNGYEDVIHRLVDGGADPNLTNGDGATAMMILIVNDRLDLAAKMLELGADADDGSLYHAVAMHDATTDMHARDGSRLRANHPNNLTALELIEVLLDAGADPNKAFVGQLHSKGLCCDGFGNATPFYQAAVASDVSAMGMMILRGADLTWTPTEAEGAGRGGNRNVGKTAMGMAMVGGKGAPLAAGPGYDRDGVLPPFREVSNREPIDALRLLLEAGADPDVLSLDGSAPIHQAVDLRDLDMIQMLANFGATLDLLNGDDKTALELAEADDDEIEPAPMGNPLNVEVHKVPIAEVVGLLRDLMGLPPAAPETETEGVETDETSEADVEEEAL